MLNRLLGPTPADSMLSVLRIAFGLLYLEHGTAKHLGFPHLASFDALAPFSLMWFAGTIELVCGSLIVLGLFTRAAAFVASGEMAVAYFITFAPRGFFPLLNGGTVAAAYCLAFLYLAVAGGGRWSLDRLIGQGAGEGG